MYYKTNPADAAYVDCLQTLLNKAETVGFSPSRPGVNTVSSFGSSISFLEMDTYFPIVGIKKINFHSALCEILWMLRGETNIKWMNDQGVKIWDNWASPGGEVGPVYGAQWRNWNGEGKDQFLEMANGLLTDPYGRRHITTAWNPSQLHKMNLPPCHLLMQVCAEEIDGIMRVTIIVYQRSADVFVGVPFNWVHYGVILQILVRFLNSQGSRVWEAGSLIFQYGNLHLYENHVDAAKLVIARWENTSEEEDEACHPQLALKNFKILHPSLFVPESFKLTGYNPMGHIKVDVAI